MVTIIHVETEQVFQVARQLSQTSEQAQQLCSFLLNQVKGIDWQGPSREEFLSQCDQTLRRLIALTEQGTMLGQRVINEVEEWINVDQNGEKNFASIATLGIMGVNLWGGILNLWWGNIDYSDYKEWWKGLDQQERIDYLIDHHKKIAKDYGFPPMAMLVEDLDDSKGDSIGLNRGNQLVFDVDNFNSNDPWRVIETMAHESRHEYQHYVVDLYEATGTIPDNMTKDQVEAWQKCFNDYAKPEDDFESYWLQAIESDARDFGGDYMKEVLSSKDWE